MSYDNPWKYQGKVFESEDIQDNLIFYPNNSIF